MGGCKDPGNCIEIEKLTKVYYLFNRDYKIFRWLFTRKGHSAEKKALDHINLEVRKGEVLGIIGKNGSGKSTLMKLVAGITFPTAGEIRVSGSIGSLINLSAGFNSDFTGRRNIYYKASLLGMSKEAVDKIIDDIVAFVDIGEYFDMPLRTYSSGMAARLGFALAIFSDPDILIVDEVFAVGDKTFQSKSREKTVALFRSGKSVLFASHSDQLIREFCTRVIYLKDSKVAFDGDVEEGLAMYARDMK